MARFGDNPIANPVPANALIPFEDPTNDDDFCVTPAILTSFVQEHMALANGTNNGLMSGAQADKLNALYTKAQLDSFFTQLGQFPFPVFIASPVDGFIEVYQNVLGNEVVFDFMYFDLSSGSTFLTVKIDGVPVTGWTNVLITNVSGGAVATAAKTIPPAGILGLEFSGSGAPENLRVTMKGNVVLT